MSYDLIAVRVPAGIDPQAYYEDDEREIDESPPTALERAEMERLATAIAAVDPSAHRYEDDEAIEFTAGRSRSPSTRARREWRSRTGSTARRPTP